MEQQYNLTVRTNFCGLKSLSEEYKTSLYSVLRFLILPGSVTSSAPLPVRHQYRANPGTYQGPLSLGATGGRAFSVTASLIGAHIPGVGPAPLPENKVYLYAQYYYLCHTENDDVSLPY